MPMLHFVVLEDSPLTCACIGIGTHDEALALLHARVDELTAAGWKDARALSYKEDLAYLAIELETPVDHMAGINIRDWERPAARIRMLRCSFTESLIERENPLDVRLKA